MESDFDTSWLVEDYPDQPEYEVIEEDNDEWAKPGLEIISRCPLCNEYVYDTDDYIVDDSNTYGGICHTECFQEAEHDRLG